LDDKRVGLRVRPHFIKKLDQSLKVSDLLSVGGCNLVEEGADELVVLEAGVDVRYHRLRLLAQLCVALAHVRLDRERWEPFDLGNLAENVLLGRRQDAERRDIHIDAAFGRAPAVGDPRLVESLVANLVDNALHHNLTGGQIEITTTSVEGAAYIAVSNTGPVVLPSEVERLFQPLQQIGRERVRHTDGHGLGLAIVQAIAKTHGARVTARPRHEGGLDIEVTFPSKIVT
jgi:signal transduction histidine kinase